jgi:hypothetical protein
VTEPIRLDFEGRKVVQVSMRIAQRDAERLRKVAISQKRTVQKQLEWILARFLDEYDKRERVRRAEHAQYHRIHEERG